MECRPEFATEHTFVFEFLREVPERQPSWAEYVEESDESLPVGVLYDLARGMVTLAEKASEVHNNAASEALSRAFAFLERGMQESEVGPIPNLIRTTMCD